MKKMIVKCNTSPEEIINTGKAYYSRLGFETQSAMTESGDLCMQVRKTSLLRNMTGTSYALQLVVKKVDDNSYELTAGWSKWADKVIVGTVATFVAFGFLIIPTCIGISRQAKMPTECLNHISDVLKAYHPECIAYHVV